MCCVHFIRQKVLIGDEFHCFLELLLLPVEAENRVRDPSQGLFVTGLLRRIYSLS